METVNNTEMEISSSKGLTPILNIRNKSISYSKVIDSVSFNFPKLIFVHLLNDIQMIYNVSNQDILLSYNVGKYWKRDTFFIKALINPIKYTKSKANKMKYMYSRDTLMRPFLSSWLSEIGFINTKFYHRIVDNLENIRKMYKLTNYLQYTNLEYNMGILCTKYCSPLNIVSELNNLENYILHDLHIPTYTVYINPIQNTEDTNNLNTMFIIFITVPKKYSCKISQ